MLNYCFFKKRVFSLIKRGITLVEEALRVLLKLFYPAECLHCEGEIKGSHQPLCGACLSQVEWLQKGCVYCSIPIENRRVCKGCFKRPLYLQPHASFFLPLGPVFYLYQDFLCTKRPETLASFVVIGLNDLSFFPMPNCVVPLLRPRHEGFFLKKQNAFLLAMGVAKLLHCPLYFPGSKIEGKRVLLVTDWLNDGKSLFLKKRELRQFFPKDIFSIALIDARLEVVVHSVSKNFNDRLSIL